MNAEQRAFYEFGVAWGVAKATKKAQSYMMVKSGTTLETGLYMYKCRFSHLIRDAWHKRAVCRRTCRVCENLHFWINPKTGDYYDICAYSKEPIDTRAVRDCEHFQQRKEDS